MYYFAVYAVRFASWEPSEPPPEKPKPSKGKGPSAEEAAKAKRLYSRKMATEELLGLIAENVRASLAVPTGGGAVVVGAEPSIGNGAAAVGAGTSTGNGAAAMRELPSTGNGAKRPLNQVLPLGTDARTSIASGRGRARKR